MSIKKLFLSHFNGDAPEIHRLATELRLHGIVPWVDKLGGFNVGDNSVSEARRAICEDSFGMLFYATEAAFSRDFIRQVEMDEAVKRHTADTTFALFAVPRNISFAQLGELSRQTFGIDLSAYHTVSIPPKARLTAGFRKVAIGVLHRVLETGAKANRHSISLQFSTREILPAAPDDVLCIDAVSLLSKRPCDQRAWAQLTTALQNVKAIIAQMYGRPRLKIHGSKHLTGAFILGRVFAPFDIDLRQTHDETWRTDAAVSATEPLVASVTKGKDGGHRLFVEVASGNKDLRAGVDAFIKAHYIEPEARLQLRPPGERLLVDNEVCLAMARQTYQAIEKAMRVYPADELHLFVAAPQSFMIMLGRAFAGMPPTYVYEWNYGRYELACRVPGGVL